MKRYTATALAELETIGTATVRSVIKWIVIAIIFAIFYFMKSNNRINILLNEFHSFFKMINNKFNLISEKVNFKTFLDLFFKWGAIFIIAKIITNIFGYFFVKKSRSKSICKFFGIIKFITFDWFSGVDYMFVKDVGSMYDDKLIKDKEPVNTPTPIIHNTPTSSYNTINFPTIKENPIKQATSSEPPIKQLNLSKRYVLRILVGIITIIAMVVTYKKLNEKYANPDTTNYIIYVFTLIVGLLGLSIILYLGNKESRFLRYKKHLKTGMTLKEVEAIMHEFGYQDQKNGSMLYSRSYRSNYKRGKHSDFEGVTLYFSNGRVTQIGESYHRTTTYYR